MNLWFAYDFLGLMVRDYMAHTGQCLYNALVIKIARQPEAYLLKVRDDLIEVQKLIEAEIAERQVRRSEAA